MAKGPTVYDVAKRAGVSIATVSFVFRRPERVKEATRQAVLAAARDLGYVPNASARGLAHGRTGAIGLYSFDYFLDALEDPRGVGGVPPGGNGDVPVVDGREQDARLFPLYVDEVQRGVELECWRRGYALMIGGGSRASSGAVVTDIAGRVDGLAVFPATVSDEILQHVARRIPVVEVSEPSHRDGINHVTVDNAGGMRALTEHLISVHGLRDLQFVGGLESSDVAARFKGFRAALRSAGLSVPKPLSHPGGAIPQAESIVGDLQTRGTLPEALVCATDQDALAVMDALRKARVRVPSQVAVTGFDGILAGRMAVPTLTTVRQPMEQMGRAVVDILIDRFEHPHAAAVSRQLPVRVVIRESCGCRPRRQSH